MKDDIYKMYKYVYLLIVLFWSCEQSSKMQDGITVTISEEGIAIEEDSSKVNVNNNDCIFDQVTQTDEFLKGIKEFDGYSWNDKTKIATINLSEKETLKIHRGGCDYYMVSALFKIEDLSLNYPKDKDYILDKVKWVSQLIEDFKEIEILELIKTEKFAETKKGNSTTLELLRFEDLMKVWIWINNESKYSEIVLSYRIN